MPSVWPWFDAAHHDRFILHGAGYQSRYAAGLEPSLHGIYSDDYITTGSVDWPSRHGVGTVWT